MTVPQGPSDAAPRTAAGRRFVENWNLSLDQPVTAWDLRADIAAIEAEAASAAGPDLSLHPPDCDCPDCTAAYRAGLAASAAGAATNEEDDVAGAIARLTRRLDRALTDRSVPCLTRSDVKVVLQAFADRAAGAAAALDVERLAEALDGLDVISYDVDLHGMPLDIDVAAQRIAAAYNAPATPEAE